MHPYCARLSNSADRDVPPDLFAHIRNSPLFRQVPSTMGSFLAVPQDTMMPQNGFCADSVDEEEIVASTMSPQNMIPQSSLFVDSVDDEETVGYCLSGHFLPEDIVLQILSYVPANDLLTCALVCKNWNSIIKSNSIWYEIYRRKYKNKKPKKLPWYVYYALFGTNFFDTNLIRNGNGQENLKYWTIVHNGGDGVTVEDPPQGCPALPLNKEEFNGRTGCFATSFGRCTKSQTFDFNSKLFAKILSTYKPHIYASEWVCPRFDCGSIYRLHLKLGVEDQYEAVAVQSINETFAQFSNPDWKKVEILVDSYDDNITQITFEHDGKDTQFWLGHYGSKMTGGVLRILFDSIQPRPEE